MSTNKPEKYNNAIDLAINVIKSQLEDFKKNSYYRSITGDQPLDEKSTSWYISGVNMALSWCYWAKTVIKNKKSNIR